MSDRIPALLEPIQNRLNAQLPDAARLDAYYYGFTRTGFGAVDAILSAVAIAGKGSHHTESWGDTESAWYYTDRPGLPSAVGAEDLIQRTADLAARNITTDQARLLAAVQAVTDLADQWKQRGEHLITSSEAAPEDVREALADQGHDFTQKAAFIRQALTAALGGEA